MLEVMRKRTSYSVIQKRRKSGANIKMLYVFYVYLTNFISPESLSFSPCKIVADT